MCLFLTEATEGTRLPRLQVKRLAKADWAPKHRYREQRYRKLEVFAIVLNKWTETPGFEDGWRTLEAYGLTKDVLRELWDDQEVEVQILTDEGEWQDVFKIEEPDNPPVKVG